LGEAGGGTGAGGAGGAGAAGAGGAGGTSGGTTLTGVVSLSAGRDFACAVLANGTARCWGENDAGELGSTAHTLGLQCGSNACVATATPVTGLAGATAISTGNASACALVANGAVQCWGDNTNGQLGNGTTTGSPTPAMVLGLSTTATAISAGNQFACALLTGGSMACWGGNVHGNLGNGTIVSSLTPTAPTGLGNITAVNASNGRTCALSGGTVQCWGDNALGELGVGTTNDSYLPVAVPGLSGITAISAGGFFTCALLADTSVQCWGDNQYGELGAAAGTTTPVPMPVAVAGLTNVTALSAGREGGTFACALLADGTVKCWGHNNLGQLGNGTTTDSATPVTVSGLGSVTAISTGNDFACALLSGGTVSCWGRNNEGQLGNGTTTNATTPVAVKTL
jgi:alpha-tubulin suppressor-like RCC1 family protein